MSSKVMKILNLSDFTPISMEVNAEPYHDFLPPDVRKSTRETFLDDFGDFVIYIDYYNHRI